MQIGGRDFTVACQEGEEPFLQAAARMLDAEAGSILEQVGRMPTDRMLLMAGLMLADKTAALEEELASSSTRLAEADATLTNRAHQIAELQDARNPDLVAVIPAEVHDHLAELAARAEALAAELETDE